MDYYCSGNCPDPNNKEEWRQYVKCSFIGAGVALVICGVVFALLFIKF